MQFKTSQLGNYSEALKKLITKVFTGEVTNSPVEVAFDYAFKNYGGKITFPFISFYQNPEITFDRKNSAFSSYNQGKTLEPALKQYDDNGNFIGTNNRLTKNTKSLYIILGYQIDIWGSSRAEAEQLTIELLFWLIDNQELSVEYLGQHYTFSFTVSDQILDNSDLTTYQSQGKLYRYTLAIEAQVALFKSENYITVLSTSVDVTPENNI